MTKHPAAYDPLLQDKIEKVCKTPEEWSIIYELERSRDHLDHNKRMVRALLREIDRAEQMVSALELALLNIKDMRKECDR